MMKKGLVVLFVLCLLLLSVQIVTAEGVEPPYEGENQTEEPLKEQNEDPNGTCNMTITPEQEMTQNGTLEQNQEQNGTNNMTMEKEMTQNGTLEQNQEQNMNQTETKQGETQNDEATEYQWRYKYRNEIQKGIENETVVKECDLSKKAGKMYINSYEYQNGMSIEIKEQSKHKLEIKVSAEFKEGKVLVLNIDESAFKIKNSQELKIKFDGAEMKEVNVDEVINGTGTEALYASAIGENGGQYLVYIPHFSEHLITFEIVDIQSSQSVDFMLGAVGIGLLTVLVLVIVVIKIGNFKKD